MRNGPAAVVVLIVAAAFGAWLGPAGERVDPIVGPLEAFFRYALVQTKPPGRVFLSVNGRDPSAALMLRFGGDVRPLSEFGLKEGSFTRIDVDRLDWLGSDDHVRCTARAYRYESGYRESNTLGLGTRLNPHFIRELTAEFVLTPRGKWEPVPQPSPQPP